LKRKWNKKTIGALPSIMIAQCDFSKIICHLIIVSFVMFMDKDFFIYFLINVTIGLHKGMNEITLKKSKLVFIRDVLLGLIIAKIGFMS
jgi:Na+/citrate or Na+/malate symporter